MVELVNVNTNDTDKIKYIIRFLKGSIMVVTTQFLNSRNVQDIRSIQDSSDEYISESKNLTQEQIENIMFFRSYITFTTGIKYFNDKFYHLHPKSMFRIEKLGVLPSSFIDLKDDVTFCAS